MTLSSLKEELTLLSRAPDSSRSDSSAISSLNVFGLVDIQSRLILVFGMQGMQLNLII